MTKDKYIQTEMELVEAEEEEKKKKKTSQGVCVMAPISLYKRLKVVCKQLRTSQSDLLRGLLEEAISLHEAIYIEPVREAYIIKMLPSKTKRFKKLGFVLEEVIEEEEDKAILS